MLSITLLLSLVACGKEDDIASSDNTSSALQAATDGDMEDPENAELKTEDGASVDIRDVYHENGKANGIDVSKWQSRIDWQAVKAAGIDFAMIRIGYRGENGKLYRDANADYNIQQAETAGLLIGVYFFSTAISPAEAREEAEWVASAISGYSISYPVAYDCEGFTSPSSRMYGLSAAERTDNALAFIESIENAGYSSIFYASKNDLEASDRWDTARLEAHTKIWLARYTSPPYPETKTPDYSGKYDMWQYTNHGKVSGIETDVDLVVSYFVPERSEPKNSADRPSDVTAPPTVEDERIYTAVNDSVTAIEIVNLRSGPSTKYEIVGSLESGTFLKRTAIGSNGWSKLQYNGQTVYAITSYLSDKVVEPTPEADIVSGVTFKAANDTVTAIELVNLRSLPTTNSEIVGSLKNGDFLKRTAIGDKGWSRLELNGRAVYAITSYLTTDTEKPKPGDNIKFTAADGKITAKSETNLRSAPTTVDSEIVYTLKNGEYLERTGVSDQGWTRLVYNGQTVYAVSSYLTTGNEEPPKPGENITFSSADGRVTAKEETNLRSAPTTIDSEIVYTLKNGEYLERTVISVQGWTRLVYNGQTVYAVTQYLTE